MFVREVNEQLKGSGGMLPQEMNFRGSQVDAEGISALLSVDPCITSVTHMHARNTGLHQ